MEKYSEKYLNDYKILSKAIIGFEFEGYFNISFYKVLEKLNKELAPVKVHGFRTYHSSFKPDKYNFKIERDWSGGENLCEIVTGPQDYFTAKFYLIKILKFIQKYGFTNDKSSIHINISFKDNEIRNINILKLILNMDEDFIYKYFPNRKNNIYAKSIKTIIPYKDYDYSNISINTIKNNLQFPDNKYYGINLLNIFDEDSPRLEFRYLGGKDYEYQIGYIIEIMNKFIINTYENLNTGFTEEDEDKVYSFLKDKIHHFKSFEDYDSFLVEFPNIELQVDQNNTYEIVNSYYRKIHPQLFDLIESCGDMGECIINYYTTNNKLEIINSNFTSLLDISGFDFINCEITDGIFYDCNFVNTKINNAQLRKAKMVQSTANNSKVYNCNVDGNSELNNSFFQAGYLNGYMSGGVFRSGKIGPFATLSPETKVIGKERKKFFGDTEDKGDTSQKKKKKYG